MAVVDIDGTFLAVNTALCELVGRPASELLQTKWQAITHPDDVAQGEREVRRAIREDGKSFRLPKRYVRPDGECVWVLLTVSMIPGENGEPMYLLTQVVDITEQRKAEEELAQMSSIVESSGDAILSMDLNGTILTWNPAAQRLFGYESKEITGRSILTMVVAERRAQVGQMLAQIRTGGSVRTFDTVTLRNDSLPVEVAVTLSPLFDGFGVSAGASIIARDVSAQRRMAAELDGTLRALASALDEARTSEARTRTFLSDAAHHLRNPVAGISACAESLLRGPDSHGSERLLAEILRETTRVSRLVDRLLRIARLAEGESLILQPCDLTGLCEDEAERAGSMAPHLSITVSAKSPVVRHLDEGAVREIVRNLLENARRHAGDASPGRDHTRTRFDIGPRHRRRSGPETGSGDACLRALRHHRRMWRFRARAHAVQSPGPRPRWGPHLREGVIRHPVGFRAGASSQRTSKRTERRSSNRKRRVRVAEANLSGARYGRAGGTDALVSEKHASLAPGGETR